MTKKKSHNKSQHSFLIKQIKTTSYQRMKIDGISLNIVKRISKNIIVNLILNDKTMNTFPLRSSTCKTRVPAITITIRH